MKYESASEARSDLARRITERAARLVETRVIVAVPGEPARGRSALDHKLHELERLRALAMAEEAPALRRMRKNVKFYQPSPRATRHRVAGEIVRELVDEGRLEWVNAVHSAAILTERGKRGA